MDSDSNKNKNDRRGLKSWLIAALLAWFRVGALESAAAQSVTLNFKDAELDAVIGWVSEQTDKNFVVDPRVKSKVTIVSGKQHNKDEIYQVFLSVLQVHGFAAVPAGDIIKIMPDVNAKQSGVPVAGTRGTQRGDEMVTRVIPLDNVPAAQLVPILRPLIPQQGHMVAYPPSNVLIVSERAINIDRIVGIISHLDIPLEREGDIHVVYLRYANAKEMVPVLTGIGQSVQQEEARRAPAAGGATPAAASPNRAQQGQGFTIQADASTNALVITAPMEVFRPLQAVIRHLDVRRAQVVVEAIIAEISMNKAAQLGVQWAVDAAPPGGGGGHGPIGFANFQSGSGSSLGEIAGVALGGAVPTSLPEG